ncbi:hypothetical protein KKF81_07365 [Candidatus Micrarchaeota archaeon]|nr:hypothetical protein [Candidatus Micrarchaeota archaeon]MBU1166748.1 hypothetical protein [Candidatus Micrarchaeota archaeon]MBU1886154.1 hypothetical protein [Candidatus Micrarchaeota archaeon]
MKVLYGQLNIAKSGGLSAGNDRASKPFPNGGMFPGNPFKKLPTMPSDMPFIPPREEPQKDNRVPLRIEVPEHG